MKRASWLASRVAIPLAVYLLLEWVFARVTLSDGLLTPGGLPNLGVVAIGAAYLALRIFVHLGLPVVAVLAVVRAVRERSGVTDASDAPPAALGSFSVGSTSHDSQVPPLRPRGPRRP